MTTILKKPEITGSTLKFIAMICMLTDHFAAIVLGAVLVRNGFYSVSDVSLSYMAELILESPIGWVYFAYQIMRRLIGRFAFPIFCFLLIEGFQHTRSRVRYAARLLTFAVISEIPFNLAFRGSIQGKDYQNVFFTLLIGFLMIWLMNILENRCNILILRYAGMLAVFLTAVSFSEFIHCDYGARGIIAIALLYLFRRNKVEQIIAGCVAFLWEITAPLGFFFVALYNGERGRSLKYFFYFFYPVHLLLLYLITKI